MNVDIEIYMKNFISFFDNNPNDLLELIGDELKYQFFDEVKKQCFLNLKKGEDIVLTQQQLIDIVVKLKRAKPKDVLVNGVFEKTNFGLISLN